MMQPVFRFAPSPNGHLHLGHALSALTDFEMARRMGGRFLLRMEDIDPTRCRPEFEAGIVEDLHWLGIEWDGPVRRQSEHLDAYRAALEQLAARGLVYPSFESRELRVHASEVKLVPDAVHPVVELRLEPARDQVNCPAALNQRWNQP